ncbi:MAG: hypothetical protein OSJ59_02265 [Lachnospiraceae bacterium]|nr:hypothetical protein [Lachnospiraceae bacterium]
MEMKKLVVALGIVLVSALGLYGCGRNRELTEIIDISQRDSVDEILPSPVPIPEEELSISGDTAENEADEAPTLTALADTLDEAQEIADLYGIELESYSYGVATYRTDKDISELINLGMENDYPTLAPNTKNYLHTAQ